MLYLFGVAFLIAGGFLFFGPITVIATPVLIFVWLESVVRARRRRGQRILSYLEYAVRMNVPLPPWIQSSASQERPKVGRRLNQLAELLRRGTPIAQALAATIPEVSVRQRELIGAAERTGRLAPSLTQIVHPERELLERENYYRWLDWVYPFTLSLVILTVLSGFMVFVLPKYQEIFADFDTDLPWITRSLVDIGAGTVHLGKLEIEKMTLFFGLMVGLILLWVVLVIVSFGRICRLPRNMNGWPDLWLSLVDRIPWFGRMMRDRQMADVCFTAGSALRSSVPLHSALTEARSLQISPKLKDQLARWSLEVSSGYSAAEAARLAGMPSLVVGMLSGGEHVARLDDTMDFLYRYYRGRFSRAAELIRGAIVPATVLVMGSAVAWVAMGMFIPLFSLLESVASG